LTYLILIFDSSMKSFIAELRQMILVLNSLPLYP